jgi:hypothetical protein
MKNIKLFWYLKIEKCLKRVKFEVFTAVTMKNGVVWGVTPGGWGGGGGGGGGGLVGKAKACGF